MVGGVEQGTREFALVLSDMFGQFSAESFLLKWVVPALWASAPFQRGVVQNGGLT